jgi:hypothetical protein
MAAGDPGTLKRNFSATAIETTLVNAMTSAATGDTTPSVSVVSVSGFPSTVPYTLILGPDTNKEEVVTVTAASSTTLTITRGQDNTQAVAHAAGTSVRHGVSARDFKEEQTHQAARGYDADTAILSNAGLTHVHGLVSGDGSVVGADQSVTLTRKTLTTPTINGATLTGTVTSTASIVVSGAGTITGLSSAGMVASSAAPKNYVDSILGSATSAGISAASAAVSATSAATSASSALTSQTAAATSATSAATSASSALTSQTAAATSATSAAASATAAATSATSAAASATAAATSATSAAASATTAAASVATIAGYSTSAANSASAAATSATSAAASATAAATSATSAAASATTASNSAGTATTQAGNASASATAAATSATSAAASATAAATSATSAATSASSALTSQTAAATSATSAATSASDAATTYDNFDDRYLGSKASAPASDNDGNALLVGAIYWNSTLNNMYVWSGTAWVQIASSSVYSAPTLGSQVIASGTTYTNIDGLTLNSTTIPNSKTLADTNSTQTLSNKTLDAALTLADPTVALGVATKQYVDAVVGNTNYHAPVVAATFVNISSTYNNGTSGVGATLTATSNGVIGTVDGVTLSVTNRILVKAQTTQTQNGIYTVTSVGSAGTPWVITRATDADNNPAGEMANGDVVFCLGGTTQAGKTFINASTNPITIGTTNIVYSEYTTALPSQTGNSGKYLTTDGTTPSWGAASGETFNPLLLMGA